MGFPRPLDSSNNIFRVNGHGQSLFGERGCEAMAWVLRRNLNIVILDISDNAITPVGMRHFVKALLPCKDLRELHISGNPLKEKGAEALAESIRGLRLDILNVTKCRLGPLGTKALAKTAIGCTKQLLIDQNELGDAGAEALCGLLKQSGSIRSLEMSSNGIGPEGGRSIGEMLAYNKTVRDIHIGQNPLGDQGMLFVCQGLRTNSSLLQLYATVCEFGDPVVMDLGQVVGACNATLELVDFSNNYITDQGFMAVLGGVMQGCNQKVVLDVRANRLSGGVIGQYKKSKRVKVWQG